MTTVSTQLTKLQQFAKLSKDYYSHLYESPIDLHGKIYTQSDGGKWFEANDHPASVAVEFADMPTVEEYKAFKAEMTAWFFQRNVKSIDIISHTHGAAHDPNSDVAYRVTYINGRTEDFKFFFDMLQIPTTHKLIPIAEASDYFSKHFGYDFSCENLELYYSITVMFNDYLDYN